MHWLVCADICLRMFLRTIRLKCRPSRKIINLKCTLSCSQISMQFSKLHLNVYAFRLQCTIILWYIFSHCVEYIFIQNIWYLYTFIFYIHICKCKVQVMYSCKLCLKLCRPAIAKTVQNYLTGNRFNNPGWNLAKPGYALSQNPLFS